MRCLSTFLRLPAVTLLVTVLLHSCGVPRTAKSQQKIIGGTPAQTGEYTSVVAILRGESPICSGVILAPTIVLSAAHCFEKLLSTNPEEIRSIQIFEGTNANDLSKGRVTDVTDISLHSELWSKPESSKDMALIVTSQPLAGEASPLVTARSEISKLIESNSEIKIAGFGLTRNSPIDPEQVSLGIKNYASATIRGVRGGDLYVGDGASDTCSGDSGGPALIKLNDGRFGVVAITARGPSPCAQENEPGTMTLVRMGVCWFQNSQPRIMEGLEALCAAEQTDDVSTLNENQQQVLLMKPSVDLSNLNIQSLEWVSVSSSVENLNLAWNNIADAKPLLRLKQLKSVDIRGNKIDDKDLALALEQKGVRVIGAKSQAHNYHQTEFLRISALGAAAGTDQRSTILGLREILTKGTNLRRSADLATRVHIGLSGRDIRSLNPLEGLESAEVLLLNDNPLVTDLSPLVTLPRLRYLDITGTGIAENSDNLATMKALKEHGVIIKTDL